MGLPVDEVWQPTSTMDWAKSNGTAVPIVTSQITGKLSDAFRTGDRNLLLREDPRKATTKIYHTNRCRKWAFRGKGRAILFRTTCSNDGGKNPDIGYIWLRSYSRRGPFGLWRFSKDLKN